MSPDRRFSEYDLNRAGEFVDYLLSLPALKNESLITAERFINNFLEQNTGELVKIFQTPRFFPELDWNTAAALIRSTVFHRVSAYALPFLNGVIDNDDLSFFDRITGTGAVSESHRKRKLHDFMMTLFRDSDARYEMNSSVNVLRFNAVERYLSELFRRNAPDAGNIFNLEGVTAEPGEYIKVIKTALLIKNVLFLNPGMFHGKSCDKYSITERNLSETAEYAVSALPGIPRIIIDTALESNLPEQQRGGVKPVAGFIYILCSMFRCCREFDGDVAGAEPQEKSWLKSAVKTFIKSGKDRELINCLYIIAEENKW